MRTEAKIRPTMFNGEDSNDEINFRTTIGKNYTTDCRNDMYFLRFSSK